MSYRNFHAHADGSVKQTLSHKILKLSPTSRMHVSGLSLKYWFAYFCLAEC